ncbi:protein NLRC5-like isoform X39 [Xyrauchen texanus]|uniref:protein NLRC5-like isoform X39 n=1 Tax=Xyrauchen texanus TaxID=154827 RepID=UPI002241C8BD|nr:protein NLRC5-like isoform X39 [Xyrauchen texanus]
MSLYEEREDGAVHHQRAASPESSCVSMKSNNSMLYPPDLSDGVIRQRNTFEPPEFSCVSMKSNNSMLYPPDLSDGVIRQRNTFEPPEFSCVSMKSNNSMLYPPDLSDGVIRQRNTFEPPEFSCVSMKSNISMLYPPDLSDGVIRQRNTFEPPEFSCVSMKSNNSMLYPPDLSDGVIRQRNTFEPPEFSCVSMKSNNSMLYPPDLSDGVIRQRNTFETPEFSCVSMKSNNSMLYPPDLSDGVIRQRNTFVPPEFSCVSMKSNNSMLYPPDLSDGVIRITRGRKRARDTSHDETDYEEADKTLAQRIKLLEYQEESMGNSSMFDPSNLSADSVNRKHSPFFQSDRIDTWDLITDAVNSVERADLIRSGTSDRTEAVDDVLQRLKDTHKTIMKNQYESLFEGIKLQENQTLLNRIYTQLYIIEGESEGVNEEHEVLQMEKSYRTLQDTPINCNDIFKPLSEPGCEEKRRENIKTVLTKGIAGIGKTVSVQKFIVDWAEGKANQDVDFMFVLPFRELNLIKDHQYSLHKLLLDFHPDLHDLDSKIYDECKVVFIFDGLDESRIPLKFSDSEKVSDVTETSSVGVLMSNLIKGDLLPSALIWITSRPAAANQIPSEYINRVTEIQGFNDPQKEEYFRKRISDEHQASRIISHIRRARSLHIMCHIPVFCWISSTVLQNILKQDDSAEIPQTLTEMYIHFLLIQIKMRNEKYEERDPEKVIVKLAELAFKQLMKGNVMFYEEDLIESGIDVTEASVYSGICTEIFKEESVIYQRKVYSFIHLSFQEFFAGLYVFFCYLHKNRETLKMFLRGKHRTRCKKVPLDVFLKEVVNEALKSKTGHLDLFLRFLHGISLESNQRLLQDLLKHTENNPEIMKKIIQNLKRGQKQNVSPERWLNLSHCLIEMKDNSVVEEMQIFLKSETKKNLSLAQCSTLANIILMSEEVLDEFDLNKYKIKTRNGRQRLVPAVRNCRKALMSGCDLMVQHCEIVSSALQSSNSPLRELDLSNNDVQDSGVKLICDALKTTNCHLEILRLCGCNLTDQCCESLASALQSSNSPLRELDLSNNDLQHSGVKLISDALKSTNCHLEILRLCGCNLTDQCCESLVSVLQSSNSPLRELDLSNNDLQDSGMKLISDALKSTNCHLEILRLCGCNLTDQCCESLASALQSSNSPLRELDLSNNDLQDSGVKLISDALKSTNCHLEILRLCGCNLTDQCCVSLASALQSSNSPLRELDLSNNDLQDSGVKLISDALKSTNCKLEILRLCGCNLTDQCCESLASALQSSNCPLRELGMSNNDLQDSGVKLISDALKSTNCHLEILSLCGCNLTDQCCESLASALQSSNSSLRELDLSNNDLQDSRVKLISDALKSTNCHLEILRLCGCNLTDQCCGSLASALQSSNSPLRELDLSNNDLQDSGVKLISDGLKSTNCHLEILRLSTCNLTDQCCESLASALQSSNSPLRELDLSNNDLQDSGLKLISDALKSKNCHLEILRLSTCNLTDQCCESLASALQSSNSPLRELDLSYNRLQDSGVKLISDGLKSTNCHLEILRLCGCNLTDQCCESLASSLQSSNSPLRELDLSNNDLQDSGVKLISDALKSTNCHLEILRLCGCNLTDQCCESLVSALQSSNSPLRELDLSNNDLQDSGVKLISDALKSTNCHLEILRLCGCNLNDQCCESLASALQSSNSPLRELDLSNNDLQDSGVKLISDALKSTNCKLEILRLCGCNLTDQCCVSLASALQSSNSPLRELDLSNNDLQDSGVKLISDALKSTNCKLEILRLCGCNLTDQCCESLASVLQSSNSPLRELDLSNNDLQDSGVKLISDALKSTNCHLEILRLSGCMVTEVGCCYVASALISNPSHLKELDLSYNHPGKSGVKLLTERLNDPHCTLDKLKLNFSDPEPSGLNLHPLQNCQSCVHIVDSDQWIQIEPSVFTVEGVSKFKVSTQPGRYECIRTRMRWVCVCDVTLQYHTVDGRFLNEELERLQYNRIGPVIDVTVISGKLEEAHLPHYACLADSDPSLKDAVKVLSVKDEGISVEPVELTRFHGKIFQPSFSFKTFIIDWIIQCEEHCDLLLYMRCKVPCILHVYIFPFDSHSKEVVEKNERSSYQISHPRPDRPFRINTPHLLNVPGASVHPKEGITLRSGIDPNFFKIKQQLENDIEMTLIREEDQKVVWTATIEKDELAQINPKKDEPHLKSETDKAEFFDKHWGTLVERVQNVRPVADKLLEQRIILGEQYAGITHTNSTCQDSMREICTIVRAGGSIVKAKFISILHEVEHYLLEDLSGSTP